MEREREKERQGAQVDRERERKKKNSHREPEKGRQKEGGKRGQKIETSGGLGGEREKERVLLPKSSCNFSIEASIRPVNTQQ